VVTQAPRRGDFGLYPHLLLLLLLLAPFSFEFTLGRGGLEVRLQGEVAGLDRRVSRLRAREAVSRLAIREDEHDPRVGQRGRILRIDQRLKIRPCGAGITERSDRSFFFFLVYFG